MRLLGPLEQLRSSSRGRYLLKGLSYSRGKKPSNGYEMRMPSTLLVQVNDMILVRVM